MSEHSIGIVQKKYFTVANDAPMQLDSGESLGPITIAYETYGQLNPDRNNAILICHALSGDSHVAGNYTSEDPAPGWWDECVIFRNRYRTCSVYRKVLQAHVIFQLEL